MLNEELLFVWLQLGNVIDNQRLVAELPFNEALVCGLLSRSDVPLTASDLCNLTRILKSQMNAILCSLEQKGLIKRQKSQNDRRQIELYLLPDGITRYNASHQKTLRLVDLLIQSVGEENIRTLIPLLKQVIISFDKIQKAV
ncbi:MAG: winged helix-turn-helix transcriptional regulator [Oscillospiraceae bacterium]|nr:winged helix-turn-helix transcriptional regulator [Oscillospiraceae bacterium]